MKELDNKEKQKELLIQIMSEDEKLGLYEESKKETTLEDAAYEWTFTINGGKWSNNDDTAGDNYGSFIAGARWQAEQIFEWLASKDYLSDNIEVIKKEFEQS
jgi:transposase